MFKIFLLCALAAFAAAANDDVHAEIKTLTSEVLADGFHYVLETTNDIHASSAGDEHGNVHGEYEYVSPEGVHVKVSYVADENGYQPSSDLLPTSPPVPEAIVRSLAWNAAHPQKEETSHH